MAATEPAASKVAMTGDLILNNCVPTCRRLDADAPKVSFSIRDDITMPCHLITNSFFDCPLRRILISGIKFLKFTSDRPNNSDPQFSERALYKIVVVSDLQIDIES